MSGFTEVTGKLVKGASGSWRLEAALQTHTHCPLQSPVFSCQMLHLEGVPRLPAEMYSLQEDRLHCLNHAAQGLSGTQLR